MFASSKITRTFLSYFRSEASRNKKETAAFSRFHLRFYLHLHLRIHLCLHPRLHPRLRLLPYVSLFHLNCKYQHHTINSPIQISERNKNRKKTNRHKNTIKPHKSNHIHQISKSKIAHSSGSKFEDIPNQFLGFHYFCFCLSGKIDDSYIYI